MRLSLESNFGNEDEMEKGDIKENRENEDENEKMENEQTDEICDLKTPKEELEKNDLYTLNNILPAEYTSEMVSEDEVEELASRDIPLPNEFHPSFSNFNFTPKQIPEEDTPMAVISMMRDLDFIRRWCIERTPLSKFILMAKNGYIENPYHNWSHAFSVTHFAYLLLKNLDLADTGCITHLEALAFFISAICHDLDHRATSNAYHAKCKTTLSTMYPNESSVLESHHTTQAIRILETEGCNILANLTKSEFEEFTEIMKTVIMATDISNHFAIIHDLQEIAEDGEYRPQDQDQRHLILCLMITASDLSDQTKDWRSAIKAAKSVYEEFMNQGDLEKALGVVPMDMMNREKAVVTDLQVAFVDKVAIPVYKILAKIFPKAIDSYAGILINRKKWGHLQFLYNNSLEDPDEESADPSDLQAILNALDFEGADTNY